MQIEPYQWFATRQPSMARVAVVVGGNDFAFRFIVAPVGTRVFSTNANAWRETRSRVFASTSGSAAIERSVPSPR
jgi:hypothetical protein